MALHEHADADETVEAEDAYSSRLARRELPKHRIPDHSADATAVHTLIRDELALDGNSAQNLATFCTTWVEPEVHDLMNESMDKNMIDKDEYPQTAAIESRCVRMLAELWHAPTDTGAIGCSTTGSSEAAMLAGLAMKVRWRQRRRMVGAEVDRPNLVCGPVQVCWEKFARYFDVELRQVPLEPGATGMRPHQLRDHVDENTIGVVAILGVTFTCAYEPVADIATELDAVQRDLGLDVPLHVDAASGGFVAPFTDPDLAWDFRLPRVASVNASGHKYGLSPLGVGWVVWRSAGYLPDELVFRVDYLGGEMPTFALNFSRPGGEIIAQYYNFLRLGRAGYRRVHEVCFDNARYLAERIGELGAFQLLYDGHGGLPAVCFTTTMTARFNLYELAELLRERGWQIPTYPLPPNRHGTSVQRVLLRHGIGRDRVGLLADHLAAAVQRLTAGPVTPRARTGFHH